jgi:hypothetical protein
MLRAGRVKEELTTDKENIFSNSQNVHYFEERVYNSILNLIGKYGNPKEKDAEFNLETYLQDDEKKISFLKALERLQLDERLYCKSELNDGYTALELIKFLIWICSEKYPTEKTLLLSMIAEEISENEGWCGAGYVIKSFAVLEGREEIVKISFTEQLNSNAQTRIRSALKIEDGGTFLDNYLQEIEKKKFGDRTVLKISETIQLVKRSLEDEFLKEGYCSKAEFDDTFERILNYWISIP